ncbi:MAG: dihydroneopterin triphosphate 2'-epimerase [Gammaproteobacteria bacterium]
MLTIRISNLRLRTYIGFNEDELEKRQDVVVNVRFDYLAEKAADSDDVEYAVNYKTVTKQIITLVESNKFLLLEKLTTEVLDLVMENPLIKYADVQVEKPHALRFADSVSASLSANR